MGAKSGSSKMILPYGVDLSAAEQILKELSRVGKNGLRKIDLFRQINANSGPTKSHTLRFLKYLNLCTEEDNKVFLTPLGSRVSVVDETNKKLILAQNLPEKYLTLLKWLDVEGGKKIYDIKQDIVKNWNEQPAERLFNGMINTLSRYFQYLGLVKYIRGGPASRLEITTLGHGIISMPAKGKTELPQQISMTIASDEKPVREVLVELLYSVSPSARKPDEIIGELCNLKHQLPLEQQALVDILAEHPDKNEVVETIVKKMLGILKK